MRPELTTEQINQIAELAASAYDARELYRVDQYSALNYYRWLELTNLAHTIHHILEWIHESATELEQTLQIDDCSHCGDYHPVDALNVYDENDPLPWPTDSQSAGDTGAVCDRCYFILTEPTRCKVCAKASCYAHAVTQ